MRQLIKSLCCGTLVAAGIIAAPVAPSAQAAVIAYDEFNYSTGAAPGATGGSGWTNAWSGSASWTIASPGYTYSNYGQTPSSPASSGRVNSVGAAYANLQRSYNAALGTGDYRYFAVIMEQGNDVNMVRNGSGGSTTNWSFGLKGGVAFIGDGYDSKKAEAAGYANNTTHLLVARLNLSTRLIDLFANPNLALPEASQTPVASWTVTGSHPMLSGTLRLENKSTSAGNAEGFDSLRIADSWNDAVGVAVPEPTSLALLGLGVATLLRRRRNA